MRRVFQLIAELRNASRANKQKLYFIYDKTCITVLQKLTEENFIKGFQVFKFKGFLRIVVFLRYTPTGRCAFSVIKTIGRPSSTVSATHRGLCQLTGGLGVFLIFTPKGIKTCQECVQQRLGGVCFCYLF
jgi:small subunit ribosomal protein S8